MTTHPLAVMFGCTTAPQQRQAHKNLLAKRHEVLLAITTRGAVSPLTFARALKVSPQTAHTALRALVEKGKAERVGQAQYVGVPE